MRAARRAFGQPGGVAGDLLSRERELWSRGYVAVAGIDEAGRGALVGSVVAAAVVFSPGTALDGVRDSKAISPRRREALYDVIMDRALAVGVGVADAETVDRVNVKQAARLAMKQAVENLSVTPDYLLVDAEVVPVSIPQGAIVHGDALCHAIAAASIIAKVTRDRMCDVWDAEYPQYHIRSHKGYCTREHVEAILKYGPCPLHRKTFLRKILPHQTSLGPDLGL
ncbi:MAG TPA: ribonuclease HII [Firmicutes bacterium]|nr:ribonuclease HII [Bacillota bacterium]